jgi:transcription elongation factor Elf1
MDYLNIVGNGIDGYVFDLSTNRPIQVPLSSGRDIRTKYVTVSRGDVIIPLTGELEYQVGRMINFIAEISDEKHRRINGWIDKYLAGPPKYEDEKYFNVDTQKWIKNIGGYRDINDELKLVNMGNLTGDNGHMILIFTIAQGIHDFYQEQGRTGASSSSAIVISDEQTEETISSETTNPVEIRKLIYIRSLGFNIDSRRPIKVTDSQLDTDFRCFCCNKLVSFRSMQAGHIISERWGGMMTPDNLEVVCQPCNLAMKTRHMYEYMKTEKTAGYSIHLDKIVLKEKQLRMIEAIDQLTASFSDMFPRIRKLNSYENPKERLKIVKSILRDEGIATSK